LNAKEKTMKSTILERSLRIAAWVSCAVLVAAAVPQLQAKSVAVIPQPRAIDLAICLDTSGSMSGLIESAKLKLWSIVNDLSLAEPTPELRVALITFGNDGHDPQSGWVQVQTPLTTDLDLVYEKLFALSTNGGTEYVGRVLSRANELEWFGSGNALKLVVVAGNESADQDQETTFRAMCEELSAAGVFVNSIYCGSAEDNIAPGWREVARIGSGKFASIDHNNGTVVIDSPFDDLLGELSAELNGTYVPFGVAGKRGRLNQEEQDRNAANLSSEAKAERAKNKASALYRCTWDLVDAYEKGEVELDELKSKDLPKEMQTMTNEEREGYVAEMRDRRYALQKRIAELSKKRDAYVKKEMTQRNLDDSTSFDNALRSAIREQARMVGFTFSDTSAN
jgi:hypothetical protein